MTLNLVNPTREDLLTTFRSVDQGPLASQGAMIVGVNYSSRPYNVSTSAGSVGAYVGTSHTYTIPALVVTETLDAASLKCMISNAVVKVYGDAADPPTMAQGTAYAINKVTHDSTNTVWTSSNYTVGLNAKVEVGDYVYLDDGAGHTFTTTVAGIEFLAGYPKVLVLASQLPTALQTGYFNVTIGQFVDVSVTSFTNSTTTLTLPTGLTASTGRTSSPHPVIGGTVYIGYRAKYGGTFTNVVKSVTTTADMDVLGFVGYQNPDSGLGFAIARALSPTVIPANIAPLAVKFIAPIDETTYAASIAVIQPLTTYSTLSVVSTTPAVVSLFTSMLAAQQATGWYVQMYVGTKTKPTYQLTSATGAVVNDSLTSGRYATFTAASAFAGAVAGDCIRVVSGSTYIPFVISAVNSSSVALVYGDAGSAQTGLAISVWHTCSATELKVKLLAETMAYANRAVSVTLPFDANFSNVTVDSSMLASAVAGMRAYTLPLESLVSARMEDGWDVRLGDYGSTGWLFTGAFPASYGLFCLETDANGSFISYPATTDQVSTLRNSECLTSIEWLVRNSLHTAFLPYIGLYKANDYTAQMLQSVANSTLISVAGLKIDGLGPTITDFSVGSAYVNPALTTQIIVPVTITLAKIGVVISMNVTATLG